MNAVLSYQSKENSAAVYIASLNNQIFITPVFLTRGVYLLSVFLNVA
jgi:hypothetical protein